ncbi:hypothetical protein D3C72_1916570 [compost metagenome]
MTPYRTELHAAHGLPGGLPVQDVVAAEQRAAFGRDNVPGDGWRLSVDLAAVEAQQCKGDRHHGDQREP